MSMDLEQALQHRAQVEEFRRRHRTGLVTLLFTDIVGSTQLKTALGDHAGVALIQSHHALVRDILSQFKEAEEISTAGDSFFIVFVKPSDAVRFALLLQSKLRALAPANVRPPEAGRALPSTPHPGSLCDRIGIHIGEVVIEEREGAAKPRDLYGVQVDLAARVMGLAQGDQILLTRSAFDNARQVLKGEDIPGLGELSWLNHGPYVIAGLEEPLEICEVGEAGLAHLQQPADARKAHRKVSADEEPVLGWRPAVDQLVPNTQWVLEKKLGEGGFGEVWLGRHQKLKERSVFKFCFRADRVRSLKREMTLFRVLKERVGDHPNIVRLLEVYFEEPPFYVVMDHVEGSDLNTWCEQQGGVDKVPLETRLEIVAQIADALQAAHDAGVIHRDVKPGNILVSRWGETLSSRDLTESPKGMSGLDGFSPYRVQAKLTDFGIGQVVSEEALRGVTKAGFTQTIIADSSSSQTGSQMYMAPELLAGKPASIRSDIYSLGVVLYQLLVENLARPVTTDWAKGVSDPLLREDLQHCFAGSPEDRFAGSGQLAKNLRALDQRHQEFQARERMRKQAALRHRIALVSVSAAGLFLLLAIALGYGLRQAQRAKASEARLRKLAEGHAYASDMKAAQVALQQNNRGMALSLLRQYRPKPGEEDLRGLEWRYLWQECRADEHQNFPHPAMLYGAALSPDGRYLATGCYDNKIRVWDVAKARPIQEFEAQGWSAAESIGPRKAVGFSPDGKWLATLGKDGVQIRETTGWSVVKELKSAVAPLGYSADGKWLVTGGTNGMVFWSAADWSPRVLTNVFATGNAFALAPDGTKLACYYIRSEEINETAQARIEFWDVRTSTRRVIEGTSFTQSLAISPDGKWLAYGNLRGEVCLWNLAAWAPGIRFAAHQAGIWGLAFSPDGKRLATGASDQQIHIWETGTTNLLATRHGHENEIESVEFSRDGQKLLSSSLDGTAKLWDTKPGSAKGHAFTIPTNSWIISPLPDGSAFVTADYSARNFQLWSLPDGRLTRTMPWRELDPQGQGFRDVLGAPGYESLLGVTTNGTVHFFNPSSGARLRSVQVPETNFTMWSVSPDQRWLLGWLSDGGTTGILCDLRNPSRVQRIPDYFAVNGYSSISPDNRWLAYATTNYDIKLWDLTANRVKATLQGHRWWLYSLGFSPDGRLLASGGADGDVWLWSVETTRPLFDAPLKGHFAAAAVVAFSSDNRTLATFGADQTLRWWSVATGREMLLFPTESFWAGSHFDFPAPGNATSRLLLFYERPGQVRGTLVPSLAEIETIEKGEITLR